MPTKASSLLTLFLSALLLASCTSKDIETDEEEPVESTSSVETQTHTSESYALSFEYPRTWTVYESQSTIGIDVQPTDGIPSNYFALEINHSIIQEDPTLQEMIMESNLTKADFTIDGQDVYTQGKQEDSELLNYVFEHNNKVYILRTSTYGYEMPEVKLMISSLKLL